MIMVGGMQVVTKEGKERIEDEEVFLHTFLLQRKLLLCCAGARGGDKQEEREYLHAVLMACLQATPSYPLLLPTYTSS